MTTPATTALLLGAETPLGRTAAAALAGRGWTLTAEGGGGLLVDARGGGIAPDARLSDAAAFVQELPAGATGAMVMLLAAGTPDAGDAMRRLEPMILAAQVPPLATALAPRLRVNAIQLSTADGSADLGTTLAYLVGATAVTGQVLVLVDRATSDT